MASWNAQSAWPHRCAKLKLEATLAGHSTGAGYFMTKRNPGGTVPQQNPFLLHSPRCTACTSAGWPCSTSHPVPIRLPLAGSSLQAAEECLCVDKAVLLRPGPAQQAGECRQDSRRCSAGGDGGEDAGGRSLTSEGCRVCCGIQASLILFVLGQPCQQSKPRAGYFASRKGRMAFSGCSCLLLPACCWHPNCW